jgi:hypothetical protein
MSSLFLVLTSFAGFLVYFAIGCFSFYYLHKREIGVEEVTRVTGGSRKVAFGTYVISSFWPITMPFILTNHITWFIYQNASMTKLKNWWQRDENEEKLEQYKQDLKGIESRLDEKLRLLEGDEEVKLELEEEFEELEQSS